MNCVLSLSHGNSTPERGFSINKMILEIHGYSTYEDTLIALRLVKDELLRVGDETKFPVTRELLSEVKVSYSRYEADREVEKVDGEIFEAKSAISVANDLILQAQNDLEVALQNKGKDVQRNLIESATAKLKVGNERKRKFEDDLCKLERKRKKMIPSK
jgi:hypothetical protein